MALHAASERLQTAAAVAAGDAPPPPAPSGYPFRRRALLSQLVLTSAIGAVYLVFQLDDLSPFLAIPVAFCFFLSVNELCRRALLTWCSKGAGDSPKQWAARGAEHPPCLMQMLLLFFPGTDGGGEREEGTVVWATRAGCAARQIRGWQRNVYLLSVHLLALSLAFNTAGRSRTEMSDDVDGTGEVVTHLFGWRPCNLCWAVLLLRLVVPLQAATPSIVADVLMLTVVSDAQRRRASASTTLITTLHLVSSTVNVILWIAVSASFFAAAGYDWEYTKGTLATVLLGSGVSVALALQPLARDACASLTLVATRSFELGDSIIYNGIQGSVEAIHFRNTHVRCLDGSLVCIPNAELAVGRVINLSASKFRLISVPFVLHSQSTGAHINLLKDIALTCAHAARSHMQPSAGEGACPAPSPLRVPALTVDFAGARDFHSYGVSCEIVLTLASGDRTLERDIKSAFIQVLMEQLKENDMVLARPLREVCGGGDAFGWVRPTS
eukprot:TRINITY_DN65588_c0_g1_i1.p1 TRINITY_DN65588_c0_g1~~TRINITY_DN65588_c0_g1_i1.p1  ORF type:complete len:526 (+),score=125.87 TRINITY_DN65588_c0_g1_i1:88-1578(+)